MTNRIHIGFRHAALGLLLACALVAAIAAPSSALSPLPITCTAAGTVTTVPGTPDAWSVSGQGSCQGDLQGTYFLSFTGAGTSEGLGLCPAPPGDIVVQKLSIGVIGTLTNAATGVTTALAQTWFAPLTVYPVGTPFLIREGGGVVGAGSIFNHIFLNCSGSPVAQFTFGFLT